MAIANKKSTPNAPPNSGGSSKKSGRPRASGTSSDNPREDILIAAAHLFSEQGIAGTTISQIADEVGVKQPSIYYHFKTKQEITNVLFEYVVNESAIYAATVEKDHDSAADGLKRLLVQHVSRLANAPYDLWFVAHEGRREVAGKKVAARASRWRKAVRGLVEEGIETGEFLPIDGRVAVEMISSMIFGALTISHQGIEPDPNELADLCLRMLGKVSYR